MRVIPQALFLYTIDCFQRFQDTFVSTNVSPMIIKYSQFIRVFG